MAPSRKKRRPKSRKRRVRRTKMLGKPEKNPQKGLEEDTQGQKVPTLEELMKEFQKIEGGEAESRSKMKGMVLKESIAAKKKKAVCLPVQEADKVRRALDSLKVEKRKEEFKRRAKRATKVFAHGGKNYISCEICSRWYEANCVDPNSRIEAGGLDFMCRECWDYGFRPSSLEKKNWHIEAKPTASHASAAPEPAPEPELEARLEALNKYQKESKKTVKKSKGSKESKKPKKPKGK